MPHINLPEGVPGIRSLVMYRPETGQHLYALAQTLLRGDSPLTTAERELIATYVSSRNACTFCMTSHAATARYLYKDNRSVVDEVIKDVNTSSASEKMKALLHIAAKVQENGKLVTKADVADARLAGANDRDIHDTVLIAATFSLFNRYVDGLATTLPENPSAWLEMGERLATKGYAMPPSSSNK